VLNTRRRLSPFIKQSKTATGSRPARHEEMSSAVAKWQRAQIEPVSGSSRFPIDFENEGVACLTGLATNNAVAFELAYSF
jgi:hypothetical protein